MSQDKGNKNKKFTHSNLVESYLTPKDIANILDISIRKVYMLINHGNLESYDIGIGNKHIYRISDTQLKRYIETSLYKVHNLNTAKNSETKKIHKSKIQISSKESILKKIKE